jgi:hypothetical protein
MDFRLFNDAVLSAAVISVELYERMIALDEVESTGKEPNFLGQLL